MTSAGVDPAPEEGRGAGPQVLFVGGAPCLVIGDAEALLQLAELLDRVHRQAVYRGGLPIPVVREFVAAARHVAGLCALVPVAEPSLSESTPSDRRWISTIEAADLLGITDRAIRKRLAVGSLTGQQIAGRWFVDLGRIQTDAA